MRVRLSFESAHDDQTEKDGSHRRTSEAATSAGRAEGRATAIIGCRRNHGEADVIGYARVSTVDQNLALQRDALTEAGCAKIFTEQMSGAVTDRPTSAR